MWWAAAAGLVTAAGFVIGLMDPAYYNPVTVFDYVGSYVNDATLAVSGIALIVWSRVTPVRRTRVLILAAGVGLIVWTVGNVLEEIYGLEVGTNLFFAGSITTLATTAIAGIVTLFDQTRWRWSGLLLLGLTVGIGVDSIPLFPVVWVALAVFLARGWFEDEGDNPKVASLSSPTGRS